MQKHFVIFFSPGTFVSEQTTKPIDAWDPDVALEMASTIVERYNARPYGFQFITRSRGPDDLDSSVIDRSPIYYIGGTVETREEVFARNDPDERILRANMENNDIDRIWVSTSGWKTTMPLREKDIVLPAA